MCGSIVQEESQGCSLGTGVRSSQASTRAPTAVARVLTDRETLLRIEDALSDHYDEIASASSLEGSGSWCLELHFSNPPDEDRIRALVAGAAGSEVAQRMQFHVLEATDWVRKSLAGLSPVQAGRFVVHGSHDRTRIAINHMAIEIEASLAFGTGHHQSTQACLLAIDVLAKPLARKRKANASRPGRHKGKLQMLDVGTGSGVLAIAAAKALRRPVLASEIELRSAAVARENVRINRVARFVRVLHAAGVKTRPFRAHSPYVLIVANILLHPLCEMATAMARLAAPNAYTVISGLLTTQARAALASYRARGFVLIERISLGNWTTLVLQRKVTEPSLRPK